MSRLAQTRFGTGSSPAIRAVFVMWTAVALSSEIGASYLPYASWIATLALLLTILQQSRRIRLPLSAPVIAGGMLAVTMATTSLSVGGSIENLGQVAKLLTIVGVLLPSVACDWELMRLGMSTASFATLVNAGLLALGQMGVATVAGEFGAGRWGTVLNHPGSLAFLGLLTYGYGSCGALQAKSIFWYSAVSGASLYVVFMDGSRTGALGIALVSIYVIAVSLGFRARRRAATRRLAVVATGLVILVLASSALPTKDDSGFLVNGRVAKLFNSNEGGGVGDRLQENDLARYEALLVALNEISAHPLWGSGLDSTKVLAAEGPIVVHNAYLQSWADLGIVGFVSMLYLLLWWCPYLRTAIRRVQILQNTESRALCHGSVCGLIAYSFICLYHPLGVEISDWVHFIIPCAIYLGVTRQVTLKRELPTYA